MQSTTVLSALPHELGASLSKITSSPTAIATFSLGIVSLVLYRRYKDAIQQRIKQLQEESWLFGVGVTMTRESRRKNTSFSELSLLELNPDFVAAHPDYHLISLGDYLASLRPKQLPKNFDVQDLPRLVQQELEAGLAAGLLKALGPNLGRAVLPAVGWGPIQGQAQNLATSLATRWLSRFLTPGEEDRARLPLSILSVLALSENNAKLNKGVGKANATDDDDDDESADDDSQLLPGTSLSAMDKMKKGENVMGPDFGDLVPDTGFVLARDFHATIRAMETKLQDQGDNVNHQSTELQTAQAEAREYHGDAEPTTTNAYDPNDRSMGEPVPINPRLFPDLHLGYGGAKSTHTKRQVLQMRLLAVLLNRLGANYHRFTDGASEPLFTMQLTQDGPTISKPAELVQGLIDMGHEISVVPTSRMTSFGIGLCVKESEADTGEKYWTNIPLAVFLESGYEDQDGTMAPVMMPHSGLRMIVSGDGPITSVDVQSEEYDSFDSASIVSPLIIQHFIGIEGFCGWKSDQNPDIPFNENVESVRRLSGAHEVTRAARLAGLYGVMLNGLATDLALPFGGYGVSAVCNDSAAVLQQCLYGETNIFPLSSIGSYLQRTLRYGQKMHKQLSEKQDAGDDQELRDLVSLMKALKVLPSDINGTPSQAADAARRLLSTMQPQRPLKLMNESKRIMEAILEEEAQDQATDRAKQMSAVTSPST